MLWLVPVLFLTQAQDEVKVSSRAYTPPSEATLRVDTRVVEIAAVVRDSHGKPVAGLTKDDFRILDDGKPRAIDYFSIENGAASRAVEPPSQSTAAVLKSTAPSPRPEPSARFLALFIDDVNGKDGSMGADLKRTQAAAERFVKEALKSGVRIGVFTASGAIRLDFTTDRATIDAAIGAIEPHILMPETGRTGCPRITPYLAYRIAYDRDRSSLRAVLYDSSEKSCPITAAAAVTQAEETWNRVKQISADTLSSIGHVVDRLGTMPGKRDLIMASSGFLTVSMQEQKDKIVDKALRAGVVISALDSKGLYSEETPGSRPEDPVGYATGSDRLRKANQVWTTEEITELPFHLDALNEPMENLAEGTGGVFYSNNNDLAAGFRKLDEPEVSYRIGFRPEGVAADGSYHKLKITAKKYPVHARPGYFAPAEPTTESLQSRIDREILADDTVAGFPVGIALEHSKASVAVIASVDISRLRFEEKGGRRVQRIAFTTALIDAHGKIAAAKESFMDLSLTEATYKRLAASGLNAKISLQVPPGTYRLRQVSEEALDGKIACSSHMIAVK